MRVADVTGQAQLTPLGPVNLVHLFPGLHAELMAVLRGLQPVDWTRPTACALWSVKDIVAHLLDSCLRRLSFGRDGMDPTPDRPINGYADLVGYLNHLNALWVSANRRLSPRILMDFLDLASPQLHAYFESLDPDAPALFGVAWAGEERSPNWFDIGREYTERWLHQQQIREAVGAPGLTARHWLHPVLDIFVRALPHTYRLMEAKPGVSLTVEIRGEAGGAWTLRRETTAWSMHSGADPAASSRVTLSQETAWKLFSRGLSRERAARELRIEGDAALGRPMLDALAIMA
ncbi:MAG TPA: maleylpyruvate isomerase family mycothiol-dependent enzyme [Gemmatimonadales bacterium]|nr:maleylpyruvate isomerase family mycothiol-dependent enzyme [Gemmatimonadales bacterium]